MRSVPYVVLDVFTDAAMAGNPLAVFADRSAFHNTELQLIARELNLSETVFVEDSAEEKALKRLRIYTPTTELNAAGHPVVGTWYYLVSRGIIDLDDAVADGKASISALDGGAENIQFFHEIGAGVFPITVRRREGEVEAVSAAMPIPGMQDAVDDIAPFAEALGVNSNDILETGLTTRFMLSSPGQFIVPLVSRDVMSRIRLDTSVFESHICIPDCAGIFAFTTDTENDWADYHTRGFFPCIGIMEDPATGLASANFGAYLANNGLIDPAPVATVHLEQGLEIGRPSRIEVTVTKEAGSLSEIRVGGPAVLISEGRFYLP
jgi:trans-2,3-dihydro-3-hydroxyanthranilate isomerase